MNRCPITYVSCGDAKYSGAGLRRFSARLKILKDFPYSAAEQRRESALRAGKMSVQGVQPKLSAILNLKTSCFEVTDSGGRYLIKPQHDVFPELPENEDLCMRLAETVDIEVPLHGLIYCADGSFSYVIKRFDRIGRGPGKLALEDFAQLAGKDRNTKYDFTMERLVSILDKCTFPAVERVKLFRRCIFNYLIGNEDMHLKNFSLIRRDTINLAPAYDFLSSTMAFLRMGKAYEEIEEVALPLAGRKKNITRRVWVDYFGRERLGLNERVIEAELDRFRMADPLWTDLIDRSFLSSDSREILADLIDRRRKDLEL